MSEGHLALSGLQVRGHAMFSHEGLPLDADTLEYGWLMEITIGDITGRLTTPQVQLNFFYNLCRILKLLYLCFNFIYFNCNLLYIQDINTHSFLNVCKIKIFALML